MSFAARGSDRLVGRAFEAFGILRQDIRGVNRNLVEQVQLLRNVGFVEKKEIPE